MSHIHREQIFAFAQKDIYHLICDIDSYHRFISGCSDSKVLMQTEQLIKGQLQLQKGAFQMSLTTLNRMQPYHTISLSLIEGPFQRFDGQWTLQPINQTQTKVILHIDYHTTNLLIKFAVNNLLNEVSDKLLLAFQTELDSRY